MNKENKVDPAKTMDDWWPEASPDDKREYREAVYEYLRIGLRVYEMVEMSEDVTSNLPLTEGPEDETMILKGRNQLTQ